MGEQNVDGTIAATQSDRAVEPTAPLQPGDKVGRYAIVGLLGAGGMGRVYRARDPELDREVAIKLLRASYNQPRLRREAQAMARLKHANLATVYDVGESDGHSFIAFELIEGTTLRAWMRESARSLDARLRALIAAGRGLEAAHAAGVIHRDFKPDNVLVGNDGSIKVIDFGLARAVSEEATPAASPVPASELQVDLTATGALIGTPAYMAPEQYRGEPADARADQFGFAVTAWECIFGKRPFRGTTVAELADAVCSGAIIAPPSDERTQELVAIEAALRRGLAPDASKRYASIGELLAVLEAALASRRPTTRVRIVIVVVAIAVLAVIVASIVVVARSRGGTDDHANDYSQLSREAIRAAVNAHKAERDACYEPQARLLGAGKITIEFEIGKDGAVQSTRIASDSFGGKGDVARCLAKVSLDWRFPPPAGGRVIKIRYPFTLSPD